MENNNVIREMWTMVMRLFYTILHKRNKKFYSETIYSWTQYMCSFLHIMFVTNVNLIKPRSDLTLCVVGVLKKSVLLLIWKVFSRHVYNNAIVRVTRFLGTLYKYPHQSLCAALDWSLPPALSVNYLFWQSDKRLFFFCTTHISAQFCFI